MTVGQIIPFAGVKEPNGFLICDGRSLSTTVWEDLFNVIKYTYGGTGANFNLPDLRGSTVLGVNQPHLPNGRDLGPDNFQGLSLRNEGDTGGFEAHILTTSEMPSHIHDGTTQGPLPGNHTHGGYNSNTNGFNSTPDSFESGTEFSSVNGNHFHQSLTVNNTGQDVPHNNMQPFVVMHWVIKY